MKTTFRSVFLTSENHRCTAAFYRDVAGLDLEEVRHGDYAYWKVDENGMQLAIHDAKAFASYAFPARAESNLTNLYFHVDDFQKFLAHLEQLNIPHEIEGEVATATDPDGRKVLFGTA